MSEVEFGELYSLMQEAAYMQHLIFTSVVFAYIIAGHLVGSNLPKRLAVGVSTIYSLYVLFPMIGYWVEMSRKAELARHYHELYPEGFIIPETVGDPLSALPISVVMFVVWIGSIYYVHFFVRARETGRT